MSKIGKKPITIPQGVDIKVDDSSVFAKGPKGEIRRNLPDMLTVSVSDGLVTISPVVGAGKRSSAMWGLYRSLVQNMLTGVASGFEKTLEFQGVGYKANIKGKGLELSLGYSHPIFYQAPEGINFSVEKNSITVSGVDKELVGQVAADIRSKRKPEPYKGSGIRYRGEIIKKKAGKKAVATS
ncbi:MAG: 50S ribosomal protein L6 [Candidatus Yanofskybacteria bacterium RIFCSPHIGHO2_01_FULL_45_42]|uniref:Large ribosomal subunit protein uL6 n=3 Tax=Candidatus Yanofskyibacteriota TaxID=1752733 RepID=A0A1F8H628_9BACT|nr:MAG: 50S ribosomal protein L6 [Candidatus Yanofskybacteria bacterium RIFCSPHIGHO2_01_FULL_45_42]OGN16333.1 MAG: 50S ribosomal protein L6 [Candidatus Yanofskybacteria bacterium RIFCSPHIGHO2_02_FULL_46_19]OGN27007.1 MAG: 50S ribosomal protein L6 [Candidatus Yanofskybacteria bacterium RIFCSPLOWO2_01_FULL_45_72]OGN32416.1 MAG: 50S ribosomal protein L6 [Candidatus Yanofskybacteria bacterium RIFCSPLOWO2_02_FULL_45_18]